MMPIANYNTFLCQFEAVKDHSRLFMLVLFDSRPSHGGVERFVDANFGWLDNLAASKNMFGFAFLKTDDYGEVQTNPSLELAAHFGIQPNELPGIVAFTMFPDRASISNGVYLPLNAKLFREDLDIVEDVFADVFSIFGQALEETETEEALMKVIGERFKNIRKEEKRRPLIKFLGERIRALATLPDKLLEAAASSFGEALGTRLGS